MTDTISKSVTFHSWSHRCISLSLTGGVDELFEVGRYAQAGVFPVVEQGARPGHRLRYPD